MITLTFWRRDLMHELLHRQLSALVLSALFALQGATFGQSPAPDAPQPSPEQELQAAGLLRALLQAQGPTEPEKEKLRAIYSELEAKYPQNASVKKDFGELLWNWNEGELAFLKWQAAERLAPNDARLLHRLGEAAIAFGQTRQAAEYLERAAKIAPDEADYHFSLANVLYLFRRDLEIPEKQALEQAVIHFAEASRLKPDDADYARAYAEVFYGVPDPNWRSALLAWTHFRDLSIDKDFAFSHLARVHLHLGEKEAARDCLNQIHSEQFARLKAALEKRLEEELLAP